MAIFFLVFIIAKLTKNAQKNNLHTPFRMERVQFYCYLHILLYIIELRFATEHNKNKFIFRTQHHEK